MKGQSLIVVLVAMSGLTGCWSGSRVYPVDNTRRAAMAWGENPDGRRCLEYATAASETHDRKLEIASPVTVSGGTSVSPTINLQDKQDIAKIYNVSDILQFGHASLYRLCEARGNDDIDKKDYGTLYRDTIEKIRELLIAQSDLSMDRIAGLRADARAELQEKQAAVEELGGRVQELRSKLDAELASKPADFKSPAPAGTPAGARPPNCNFQVVEAVIGGIEREIFDASHTGAGRLPPAPFYGPPDLRECIELARQRPAIKAIEDEAREKTKTLPTITAKIRELHARIDGYDSAMDALHQLRKANGSPAQAQAVAAPPPPAATAEPSKK